jgi:hypothetical protein
MTTQEWAIAVTPRKRAKPGITITSPRSSRGYLVADRDRFNAVTKKKKEIAITDLTA